MFVLSSRPTICTSLEAARQDRFLSAANLALLLLWRAHEPSSRSTLEIPREKLLPPPTFHLILPFFKSLSSNGDKMTAENAILSSRFVSEIFSQISFHSSFPKFAEIQIPFSLHFEFSHQESGSFSLFFPNISPRVYQEEIHRSRNIE